MADWLELAVVNMKAAKLLHDNQMHRSAVTRAYYAAYCVLTDALQERHGNEFVHGRNNPGHEQLLNLTRNNIVVTGTTKDRALRKRLGRSLNHLLQYRTDAEYAPGRTIDKATSSQALIYAAGTFRVLEKQH